MAQVDLRLPFGSPGLLQQLHARFAGQLIAFAGITGHAGADHIFPSRLATFVTGNDMINVELLALMALAAILTGETVPLEDVLAGELDLFFGKAIKEQEDDNPGNADTAADSAH